MTRSSGSSLTLWTLDTTKAYNKNNVLPSSGFKLSLPIKLILRRAACKTETEGECVCIPRIICDKIQAYFCLLYVCLCDAFVSDFDPLCCHSNVITKWCSAEYDDSATLTLLPSPLSATLRQHCSGWIRCKRQAHTDTHRRTPTQCSPSNCIYISYTQKSGLLIFSKKCV